MRSFICKDITVSKDGSISSTGIIASANNLCLGNSHNINCTGGQLEVVQIGHGIKMEVPML